MPMHKGTLSKGMDAVSNNKYGVTSVQSGYVETKGIFCYSSCKSECHENCGKACAKECHSSCWSLCSSGSDNLGADTEVLEIII